MLVERGSLPPPACAAKEAVSPLHLFAMCSTRDEDTASGCPSEPVFLWDCSSSQEQQECGCVGSPTFPPLPHLIADWGFTGLCGPLAFLQHSCLPFPSLFSRQDFHLRNLSRCQSLSVSAPRLQGVAYKYPQSSEEAQSLAV